MKRCLLTTLLLAGAALTGAPALAAGPDKDAQYEYVVQLHAEERVPETHGTMVLIERDEDRAVEIKLKDGKIVVVKVDGEKISRDRIHHEDDHIIILDEFGDEMHEFRVPGLARENDATIRMKTWAEIEEPEHAPVMIGINLSEPSEALRYHLRLNEKMPGIFIDGVGEDLPAGRAGLRRFDVIVSIEGSDGASPKLLGQVLKHKQPGDELDVIIARGPDRKHFTIHLDPYDGKSLGTISGVEPPTAPEPPVPFGLQNDDRGRLSSLHDKLIAQLHKHGMDPDEIHDVERALNDARRAMGDKSRALRDRAFKLRDDQIFIPQIEVWRDKLHRAMPEIQEELDDRLDEIEDRLEELEEAIEEQLEELDEKFDWLIEYLQDDED